MSWGRSLEDAEDLTQEFFARVYERDRLVGFDARKGPFRTYLRVRFERHASHEHRAMLRIKRGGGSLRSFL